MANVTIETHNVFIPVSSSGRETYNVTFSGCSPYRAYAQGGTFTPRTVSLSGTTLVIEWLPNSSSNSVAMQGTIIVVEGIDGEDNIYQDVMALNQYGGGYNLTVTGPKDILGDTVSSTYTITSSIPGVGTFNAIPQSSWLSVYSFTSAASAELTLSITRNTGNPRSGIVKITQNYSMNPYVSTLFLVITQGTATPTASSLVYTPNTATIPYSAGSFASLPPAIENVTNIRVASRTGDISINSASIDPVDGRLIVNYNGNSTDTTLSSTIIITGTGLNGAVSTSFYLTQGSLSSAINPIWKTTVVEVGGMPYVDYTVSTDGFVVYSGRGYQMPGEEKISFELNEIVRDYVDNYLWWRPGYQTPSGWQRTFIVNMSNGSGGEYVFTKDWSYKERYYASSSLLSLNEPIINEIPGGCYVPVCVFSPQRVGDISFVYTDTQGIGHLAYGAHLDNPRQARYLFTAAPGYKYGFEGGGVSKRDIYKGVEACNTKYVLYYENAYGGIDALPIEGNTTASDKITAYTTKNQVRVPSSSFSNRRYLNEIQKTWELRTGYLSDLQASRMHHLIESTMVYLYDIAADEIYPVVIDENSLTYKTYKNQERKFFNYTFKVRESQDKIRK